MFVELAFEVADGRLSRPATLEKGVLVVAHSSIALSALVGSAVNGDELAFRRVAPP
jgi:hypothetical protein